MSGNSVPLSYEDMRRKMLDVTYELIKQYGITHTSIEKIAKACGIGKGTFYHYYPSKEWLILALIEKQAADSLHHFQSHHNGREKMTAAEGREYIKFVINRNDTLYRHLTKEYLEKLIETFPEKEDELRPERNVNVNVIAMLLSHMEGVRADVNIPLIAALVKVCSVAFLNWDEGKLLPPKSEIAEIYYQHLFSLIFEDNQ